MSLILALRRLARAALSEIAPLLAFGGACLLGLVFLDFAEDLHEGETFAFDKAILLAVRGGTRNGTPIGPHWLVHSAIELTSLGGTSVLSLVTVGAVGFLLITRRWKAAGWLLVAVCGGALLTTLVKDFIGRARPDVVLHLVKVTNPSFPSGHAAISAATYLTIAALLTSVSEQGAVRGYLLGSAIFLTLMIGATRIYLGVHWPSDVLAGWCLGAAWALLCWLVARFLRRTGRIEGVS